MVHHQLMIFDMHVILYVRHDRHHYRYISRVFVPPVLALHQIKVLSASFFYRLLANLLCVYRFISASACRIWSCYCWFWQTITRYLIISMPWFFLPCLTCVMVCGTELWLEFIGWELAAKNFQRANQTHWRAIKTLSSQHQSAFTEAYNRIVK